MNIELKWKFKWPWMHLHSRVQLLSRALFPRVAARLANLPKCFVSSFILCAWLTRNLKNGMSTFATYKWNAFFPCSHIWSIALLPWEEFLSGLGWEFLFLVLISGTPIGSGIPILFQILGIPVGFFFRIPLLKTHQIWILICKIWNSVIFSRTNQVHLISYVYQGQCQKTPAIPFPAKITSTSFTWKTSRCNFSRQNNHPPKFTFTQDG
jgi:hypothetical protein